MPATPRDYPRKRLLLKHKVLEGIADGSITTAFRRWRRPSVRAGGYLKTSVGVLRIDEVVRISTEDITDVDARGAGYPGRDDVLAELSKRSDGELYRIRFHHAGPDPRIALRGDDRLSDGDVEGLRARLDRLDRSSSIGAWTHETLEQIATRPGTRAGDLATALGQEKLVFKRNVRKLKELGLTESLEVGYRLSPRGRALWDRMR